MLVEEERQAGCKWRGRGRQDVRRGGGANRLLVEGEGQTGC